MGRKATASSSDPGFGPEHAIDGRVANAREDPKGKIFNSKLEMYPWLVVKLPSIVSLKGVQIYNRADCCGDRLRNIEVHAGKSKVSSHTHNALCGTFKGPGSTGSVHTIYCSTPIQANVVTLKSLGLSYLQINEVEILETGKFSFEVGRVKQQILIYNPFVCFEKELRNICFKLYLRWR